MNNASPQAVSVYEVTVCSAYPRHVKGLSTPGDCNGGDDGDGDGAQWFRRVQFGKNG